MKQSGMRCVKAGLAALLACGGIVPAQGAAPAESGNARPVRFIVPFPPGGGNDIVGRIVATRLSERLGQPLVVDNRGGAGGTIGTDLTAKAPPDGHTLLINNISLAVNATLMPKLPYDTLKDLTPVSLLGRQPNLIVVHPGSTLRSVQDLVTQARARPGQMNYGSGGVGTASHLATELFKLMTKTDLAHVPYKGLAPALTDLMGGRLQVIVSTLASSMPYIKADRMRALAVTTAKRSVFFPELPTLDEAGVKGYEFSTWYALLAPGGTPPAIVQRVNSAANEVLQAPSVKEQFAAQGIEATGSTPAALAGYLRSEVAKWGKVVRASGAQPE